MDLRLRAFVAVAEEGGGGPPFPQTALFHGLKTRR
jgi:hypothetical protein